MESRKAIKLVAVDLDGTLLKNDKSIAEKDLESLFLLAEKQIVVVVATGRSLHKVKDVLPLNTPIDYVIFSSGGGIYDWKKHRLLHSEHFDYETILLLSKYLINKELNFFIYRAIPHNNKFYFSQGKSKCYEFDNYLFRHTGDYIRLNTANFPTDSGQFMVIIPNNSELFEELRNDICYEFKRVKVIRTTSPVNDEYIWLEVFPDTVSKGHGIMWLCDYLQIDYNSTLGIGNDYNDLDMFEFVEFPYVLANGIGVLREKYFTVNETNEQSGVSAVIKKCFSFFE